MFALPVFTAPEGWAVRRTISDLTLAWLGLLGLVSSSRLGEIAQLRPTDIIVDGQHVALDITAYRPAPSMRADPRRSSPQWQAGA